MKTGRAREFLSHFRTGHVLLRHVGLVEVKDEAPLGHVGFDGRDVDRGGDFEGSRQLLCVLCGGLDALFEVDLHGRGVGHLACIDNLDDAGQTLGHVDRGHTGVVERTHGHLRAGFTERLSRHDAGGFEGVDAGLREFGLGACDDLAGLCRGELLLATLQHSVRQIVQDTNRQLQTGLVGGLLERGVHGIVGEFRAEGLHLAALVVALQVNVGLDAAAAALAKGDFGGWATAIAVAIAGFARGSLDQREDLRSGLRIGFTRLRNLLHGEHLDFVPLAVVGQGVSEVLGHAEVDQLLLGGALDNHQFSPPSFSSASNSQPPRSSSCSSRS